MSLSNLPIRTLASPVENHKIQLHGSDQLHHLLGALLTREELAAQIQELTFDTTGSANTGESAPYDNVNDFEDRVFDAIATATQGLPEWFIDHWHDNLYLELDQEDDTSDLPTDDASATYGIPFKNDAVLALILCLATNLEQLDLAFAKDGDFRITREVLGLNWRLASREHRPFHKLKDFSLDCNHCLASLHHGLSTKLHTLEIRDVCTSLPEIYGLFSRPCFWALKRLKLSTLPTRDSFQYYDTVRGYDLSRAIVEQIPVLEYLEITNAPIGCGPFGSFENHQYLVEMVVDYHLLVHSGHSGRYPRQTLPPNLRCLEITSIKYWGEDQQLPDLIECYQKYTNQGTKYPSFMNALFGVDHIKKFDLHLDMEQREIARGWSPMGMQGPKIRVADALLELSTDQYDIFRQMIDTGSREGLEIGIWRHGGKYPKRLLLAPNYALPWPHWSDVNRVHWTPENQEWWKFKNKLIDVEDLKYDHIENWNDIDDSEDEDGGENGDDMMLD